jgi:hypothetical protein
MPYKVFVAGEEALASDANSFLMSQAVPRFTNATQRTSQLTAPVLNQLSMRDDRPGYVERWSGSAWVDLAVSSQLAYTEINTQKTVTATVEGAADSVIAGPALSYDGTTAVLIEAFLPAVLPPAVGGAYIVLILYQDGLPIGRLGGVGNPATGQMIQPVLMARRMTPTAGSHNFTLGAIVSGGTGTCLTGNGGSGQYLPGYLRVSRA